MTPIATLLLANLSTLQLLCSMSGSGYRAIWEDVTLTTPLSLSHNCVQFTTVVSAQFWVFRLPACMAADTVALAEKLFRWSILKYSTY